MKTSVIVSSINRKPTMMRLLANLSSQTVRPDELILIEGGDIRWTADDAPEILRETFSIHYTSRASLADSRDQGRRVATGEILFFFDDDIILPETYIEDATRYLADNSPVMAVGGIYIDPTTINRAGKALYVGRALGIYADGSYNRVLPSGWADYVRGDHVNEVTHADWLFGCNSVVRARAFNHDGVRFETQMAAWSFLEDVAMGARLKQAYGDCMRILPGLRVTHDPPSSGGRISKTTLRMRILYRYIFWRDHVRGEGMTAVAQFCLGMLANLLLMLRQERKLWVVGESLKTHLFNLRHRDMDWETANEFIFSRH